MKRFSILLFALAVATAGHAANERISLKLPNSRTDVQLVPVPFEDRFDCAAPMIPAALRFSHALNTSSFDPAPFFKVKPDNAPITVRRGGVVEPDANEADLPARFSTQSYSPQKLKEATSLSLDMTLLLCVYRGFVDFVRADYALTGEIGNFQVSHEDALDTPTEPGLSMTYNSRTWDPAKGGRFLPPSGFWQREGEPKILGELSILLDLKDIPFTMQNGSEQLLVDIELRPRFLINAGGSQ